MRAHRTAAILAPLLPALLSVVLSALLLPGIAVALAASPAVSQDIRTAISREVSQEVRPSVSPAIGQAVSREVSRDVRQAISQTAGQEVGQSLSRAVDRAGSRAVAPTEAGTPVPAVAVEPVAFPPAANGPLQRRLQEWPTWQLPAPLQRAGRDAPSWPPWFAGDWWVRSEPLPGETAASPQGDPPQTTPPWRARFVAHGTTVVADRAFNAASLARALLPDIPLKVEDDRADPRRQLARLGPDQLLETTLLAWRQERPAAALFLNDELSLEVLHGSGPPRLSQVEILGRWQLRADGSIDGEQWQARYAAPGDAIQARPQSRQQLRLRLVPAAPESGPAN